MMRPDVNVAIAYGSDAMKNVAEMLRDKLIAYQEHGYPVKVSIVAEDIVELENNLPSGKSVEIAIREKMEKYFSDFDYAIFLFDEKGKAIPEGAKEETPLVSSNLIFEYGLASSAFINQELKYVYCFSPKEISGESLKYVKNLNFKIFTKMGYNPDDYDSITNMIIQNYIHYHTHKETKDGKDITIQNGIWFSFYGLPQKLPTLKYDKTIVEEIRNVRRTRKVYTIPDGFEISYPMDFNSNIENNYWADLQKLQPSGIRVSLDTQDEALNELFKKEYLSFNDVPEHQVEREQHILGRKLLYIIDRAVFIMYLRQEDYWDDVVFNGYYADPQNPHSWVKSLYELRLDYLKSKKMGIENDYYIKAINALHGVFLYQQCSRPEQVNKPFSGKLFENNNLVDIENFLRPAFALGAGVANRMIFCLAADYLALVKHKVATKTLGEFIGEKEFYLDNIEHINKLSIALKNYADSDEKANILKKALVTFYEAVTIFKEVVKCQETLQNAEHNSGYRYIWTFYALYNQARCEFMIHLVDSIYAKETSQSITEFVNKDIIDVGKDWYTDLRQSVNTRRKDYTDFDKHPLFPQFITFNLQAEYFLAFYEYELSCLIEKQVNPDSPTEKFTDYEKFQDWKDANLTITDVLSVDGKVTRLNKLKENWLDKNLAAFINHVKSSIVEDSEKEVIDNIIKKLKKAVTDENENEYDKASEDLLIKIGKLGIVIKNDVEIGGNSLFPKLKMKFFWEKEKSSKSK